MIQDSFHYVTIDRWLEKEIPKRVKHFKNNKAKTAASLGISISTLYRKMDEFRITRRHRERHQ